ncbi:MAG: YebC/PmpR family DNA-binding transcriptional regulator, partial [Desulfosarcina sp.]
YEESSYEGYGPGGAAILVESLTDNKNRAVADIRYIFNKYGGNMGENGCVAWMFDQKGYFSVDKDAIDEDQLMEIALEAGAEDVREEDGIFEVITEPGDFEAVKSALEGASVPFSNAEVTMLPQNMSPLEGKDAERMLKLMEAMDDCDDVQKVYTNADIPDDMIDAV